MAAAIGFLMIIVIVALLLKGKMSPIVVLAIVPTISALILGFVPTDILGFIADGIKTTTSNGILFIFSVIYFGVLSDTGLFDVIVNCNDRNHCPFGWNHRCNSSDYDPGNVSSIQENEY